MTPIQITSDAMAVIGLLVLAISFYALLRRKVNADAANEVLLQILGSRSPARALKLTEAAPHTYLDAVAAAIRAGLATKSRPDDTEAAIHEAYEAAGQVLLARTRRFVTRGLVGAMIVGGGVAVAAAEHLTRPLLGAGGAAAIGALGLLKQAASVRRALAMTKHEVLPTLVTVIGDAPAPA